MFLKHVRRSFCRETDIFLSSEVPAGINDDIPPANNTCR